MNLLIETTQLRAIVALILIVASYYAYYFVAFSGWMTGMVSQKHSGNKAIITLFILQKLLGLLCLGVIPTLLYYKLFDGEILSFDLPPGLRGNHWLITALLVPGIVILIYFSARKRDVQARVPQMRLKEWGLPELSLSLVGWAIYLFAYEFIFRQLLLFTWANAYGLVPAVLVNVALYSAFHLPNGKNETLGAIPFGIVMCWISVLSGSFLPAFLIHLTLSLSSEFFSIHHNPEMIIKFRNR